MNRTSNDSSPSITRLPETTSRQWRPRLAFGVVLIGIAFLSLMYVRQTGDVAATGYDGANLQTERNDWQRRNDQLQANVAQLESIDRVGQVASQRLNMGPPRHEIYVKATPVAVPPVPTVVASPPTQPGSPLIEAVQRLFGLH